MSQVDPDGSALSLGVAAELRAELARQRCTMTQLSRLTGFSVWYVSQRVLGNTSLSMADLDTMCRALGITVQDLLAPVWLKAAQ